MRTLVGLGLASLVGASVGACSLVNAFEPIPSGGTGGIAAGGGTGGGGASLGGTGGGGGGTGDIGGSGTGGSGTGGSGTGGSGGSGTGGYGGAGGDPTPGLDCSLSLVDTWSLSGTHNIHGLAAATSDVYAMDRDPNPSEIHALDWSGTITDTFDSPSASGLALAASATHLYVDDEVSGQTIYEIDLSTQLVTNIYSSPLTGGNRGMAFLASSLWHLGAGPGGVGFSRIAIPSGTAMGHFEVTDGVHSNCAASDGFNLLYVTFDISCPGSCPVTLYIVEASKNEVCSQVLTSMNGFAFDPTGLAATSKRLFLYDRQNDEVLVYQ